MKTLGRLFAFALELCGLISLSYAVSNWYMFSPQWFSLGLAISIPFFVAAFVKMAAEDRKGIVEKQAFSFRANWFLLFFFVLYWGIIGIFLFHDSLSFEQGFGPYHVTSRMTFPLEVVLAVVSLSLAGSALVSWIYFGRGKKAPTSTATV